MQNVMLSTLFGSLLYLASAHQPATYYSPPATNATTFCQVQPATISEQAFLFADFLKIMYEEKDVKKAITTYYTEDLIQHNCYGVQGAAPIITFLQPVWDATNITVLRVALDNGNSWIHSALVPIAGGPETVAIDIFRWEGTCMVEHWDALQTNTNCTNPLALF